MNEVKRFVAGVLAVAGLAALVLVSANVSGSASALTPEPSPARIVFSFGDRVVQIGADGEDRRFLTRTGPFSNGDRQGRTGDANPQISPDGSHLLLTRFTPARYYGVRRSIVVADADGTGAKAILKGNRKVSFSSPAWMPGSSSVAVAKSVDRRRSTLRSVVIASLDGKSVKTVFRLPPHRRGGMRQDMASYREPIDIGVSPDGRKLLVTVSNGYEYDRKWLVLVNRETGKNRVVGRNTRFGTFSPDGTKFAYISSAGNRGETCTETDEESCVIQGDLYVQNVDGSGKRRLTRSRAAEENPDWSPDGERIAFDANYNLPHSGAAAEIYAIAPDGSCLSWLTNGAPAGVEPDWAPDAGRSDLLCGIEDREPVLSNEWLLRDRKQGSLSVWAGPRLGARLVSRASLSGPIRVATYDDCAVFQAKACASGPEYEIGAFSTCFAGLYLGTEVGEAPRSAFGHRRGVAFLREKAGPRGKRTRAITVFTGDSMLFIVGDRSTTYAQLEAQIDGLRPVNAATSSGRLPALHLPKGTLKTVKGVTRLVGRIGVKRTSKRVDESPATIRAIATFSKRLKLLGPIKTKTCTKEEMDPFAGF